MMGPEVRIRAGFGGVVPLCAPLLPLQDVDRVGASSEEEEPGQFCPWAWLAPLHTNFQVLFGTRGAPG